MEKTIVEVDPPRHEAKYAIPPDPLAIVCTDDVLQCPDGSFVSRDPLNDCQFLPCPEP